MTERLKLSRDFQAALKKFAEELASEDDFFVLSHHDADGITSCAITVDLLRSLGRSVHFSCMKQIDSATVDSIRKHEGKTLILTDFGSGHHTLLAEHGIKDYFVIDHHPPEHEYHRQINPHYFGISGGSDISGAGMAYLVAKALGRQAMAHLAVVGAVGDMQDSKGALESVNRTILDDAVKNGTILVENDIRMFGRQSRPLTQMLAYSSEPIIPGLSGNPAACSQFIESLGISLSEGGVSRSYVELTAAEREKFTTAIYIRLLDVNTPEFIIQGMFGEVYTLLKEQQKTELRDAKEFATVLNACGRQEQPDIGVNVCLGDRGEHLHKARNLLEKHRRLLAEGIEYLTEAGVEEDSHLSFFDAGAKIRESLIGVIAGMGYGAGIIPPTKPVLAFADDGNDSKFMKVSARATWALVRGGIHLGNAMNSCSKRIGGEGGGHNIAAGARIPKEKKAKFIKCVNETFKNQVSGK
ncbi:MAG: DHH family phosphoesterase [Candidatus Altiarchaeota archaeon]